MSEYRNLKGKKVKFLTSDLSNTEAEGQIFYSDTDNDFKSVVASAAWSAGANLITARYNIASGSTPVTAGVVFGGFVTPGPGPAHADTNLTEEYNGTGWASSGNMNTSRSQFNGFGTQTTAVGAGGYINGTGDTALVEEYNGSSWAEVTNIPAARRGQAGFGTLTAGVICAGVPNSNATLHYDGTNWTAGGNIPAGTDRTNSAGAGTQTAGLLAAGDTHQAFEYDGSSWTNGGSTTSDHDGGSDTGLQTAALVSAGFESPGSGRITACETYDGTSFSTSSGTLTQGRYGSGRGGAVGTTAFICGGDANPGTQSVTEEFNISLSTITSAAWASGGAVGTARTTAAGGTQNANVIFGGQLTNSPYPPTANVEEYNGTSWTEVNNLPAARSNHSGTGTQTAALAYGGYPNVNTSVHYDGTNWTAGGNLVAGRELLSDGIGTQTAALAAGGYIRSPDSFVTNSEEYNGSSWAEGNNLNTARYGPGGFGTQTAAVCHGGITTAQLANTEEYDGTSWTNVTARPYSAGNAMSSGTLTAGLVYGGNPSGALTTTLGYDGTNWSTRPSMALGRAMGGGSSAGTSTLALATSGASPTATEEFTGETTALNVKTLTDS